HKGLDPTYWRCTRWLYADILERHPNLPPDRRRILLRRLADAYWTLGRIALRRRPDVAAAHVARAARVDRSALAAPLRAWCPYPVARADFPRGSPPPPGISGDTTPLETATPSPWSSFTGCWEPATSAGPTPIRASR